MSINSRKVHRVCVVGGGSWGTAVAKLVAANTLRHAEFCPTVTLWLHDEKVKPSRFSEARWLSDLINTEHTNPKYLPGVRLPDTVIAEPDLAKAASQATLVIIAVPHHYLHTAMFTKILSGCAPNCRVCSLVKGLDVVDGRPSLVSDRMRRDLLGLDVAVLMGANIAEEVAASQFSEATLGTNVAEDGPIWQRVFNTENFRVNVVLDATGVELCGALKPIISLGAGFCDGMDCGANTKASIIRIGLEEMMRFSKLFFPRTRTRTFFESCGVAELIVSSYGGRTRLCAEAFVRATRARKTRSWESLEAELLNGQKLPTMERLQEVMECIRVLPPRQVARFPLFSAIYSVAFRGAPPERMLKLPERVAWRRKTQGLQLFGGGPLAWITIFFIAVVMASTVLLLVFLAERRRIASSE